MSSTSRMRMTVDEFLAYLVWHLIPCDWGTKAPRGSWRFRLWLWSYSTVWWIHERDIGLVPDSPARRQPTADETAKWVSAVIEKEKHGS